MASVPRREALTQPSRDVPKPGRYRHFKGGEYELLSVAHHSETKDLLAVYRSVDDPATTWVRPLEMFSGVVERPDGTYPRFAPATAIRRPSTSLLTRLHRLGRRRWDRGRASDGYRGSVTSA
ncbi:MAG: DUF1653 domain-containing protein [Solirubrobacteraceae bacterium]